MQTMQENGKRGWKAAHATTVDEHLLNRRKWHIVQSNREDNCDTQHLTRVIQHTQNTGGSTACMRLHRTHYSVGVWRHEEAGTATHQRHVQRQQPERSILCDG